MYNLTVIVRVVIYVSIRPFDAHQSGLIIYLFQGLLLDDLIISDIAMEIVSKFW